MPEAAEPDAIVLARRLSRVSRGEYGDKYNEAVLEIYKIHVEMADRISQRRQSANAFYLSVNTVFLGAYPFLASASRPFEQFLILAVAGIALCALWLRNILSYGDLNSGKFAVLHAIETMLPIAPYTEEWEVLDRGENSSKYRPFRRVESAVPWLFGGLYLMILLLEFPW